MGIVKTLFYLQTNVVNQIGYMNQNSRKCLSYSYRFKEDTFFNFRKEKFFDNQQKKGGNKIKV